RSPDSFPSQNQRMISELVGRLFDVLSFGVLALFTYEALSRARTYVQDNMRLNVEDMLLKTSKDALKDIKVALIVVDYQNDFATGSLAIGAGDAGEDPVARIPNVNRLLELDFDAIIITKDWHPADHISFLSAARNPDRRLSDEFANKEIEMFDKVQFKQPKREQVLYPDHCVANTTGADFVPQMKVSSRAITVLKGLETLVDSYSAFMDNEGDKKSELHEVLKEAGIDAVVVCGLAYDICVFHTTKDARNLGFYAATVRDASASFSSAGARQAAEYHQENLIKEMTTDEIIQMIKSRKYPQEWLKCAINEAKIQNNNFMSTLKN
ncbi:hypothetical protein PENTCL1PPCAC_28025, partial [Pristionchus entomophagus]